MGIGDVLRDLATDFGLVEDRAGRYARSLARARRTAFLKASWGRLVIALVLGLALVGLTVLLPPWSRAFVAGAAVATVVWLLVFIVEWASGAGSITMGAAAEQWTARELRRLRRHGWKPVSHVIARYGDVDHVAIGPGGVIVVETKWVSDGDLVEDQIRGDCGQARRGAKAIRLALQGRLRGAPVHTALVYWSPNEVAIPATLQSDTTDVTVLASSQLRRWLEGIRADVLADVDIQSAWITLTDFARRIDIKELGANARPRQTPQRGLIDLTVGVVVGLVLFYASASALRSIGPVCFVPVSAVAASSVFMSRHIGPNPEVRAIVLGVLVGTLGFCLAGEALYAYFGLIHHG